MKKFLLLPIIVICQLTSLYAQPVITRDKLVQPGYNGKIYFAPVTTAGPSGANVTWDFSAAPLEEGGTFSIVSPANTPAGSSFPNANYAIAENFPDLSATGYDYYNLTNSVLELSGTALGNVPSSPYSNPETLLPFPFTYNSTITDIWTNSTTDILTITYDGYGTLITSKGTFTNVARLSYTTADETYYLWYSTDSLARIAEFHEEGPEDDFTVYSPVITTGITGSIADNITIYPVPATSSITIRSASLVTAEVFSSAGEKMTSSVKDNQLNVSTLPQGLFFLKVKTADGKQEHFTFIKE